jgi:hypothetical protein
MTTFIVEKSWRDTRRGGRWTGRARCICGGGIKVGSDKEFVVDRALDAFIGQHQGEGHGSADASPAGRGEP